MRDNLSFYENTKPAASLSIISIPTELGSHARGLAKAPDYLKEFGLSNLCRAINADISQESEVEILTVIDAAEKSAHLTEASLRRDDTVLALGGDHSSAIGTIRAASNAFSSLGVIYIDAHPDVNTHDTTLTNNVHGMVAALALGFGDATLINPKPILPENFLHIGIKDIDPAEIDFLRREKLRPITMLDIAARGLSPAFAAIEALSHRVEKIWVSMDMDSIDRAYAPGVAMPNSGGLTAREVLSLAHYVGKTCDVAGIDVVEILPANDFDNKTAALALEIIARLLGHEYNWYQKYIEQYKESSRTSLLQ